MVVGAAGQDTLFFQELLLNAKRTKVINLPIHIYYAAVSGSTVNTITKEFFEKYLRLEKVRIEVLKKHRLLEEYMERRFNYYFQNWYLEKIRHVKKEDAFACIEILGNILNEYKSYIVYDDESIKKLIRLYDRGDYDQIFAEFIEGN
jgi:hypothetical protein